MTTAVARKRETHVTLGRLVCSHVNYISIWVRAHEVGYVEIVVSRAAALQRQIIIFFFCKAFTRSGVRILAEMGCIATVPTCALTKATCSHVSIYRKGSRGLSTLYAMQTNSYTLCMMYHARRFRRPWSGFEMAQHLTTREFPRTDRRFSSLFLYAVILPQ